MHGQIPDQHLQDIERSVHRARSTKNSQMACNAAEIRLQTLADNLIRHHIPTIVILKTAGFNQSAQRRLNRPSNVGLFFNFFNVLLSSGCSMTITLDDHSSSPNVKSATAPRQIQCTDKGGRANPKTKRFTRSSIARIIGVC